MKITFTKLNDKFPKKANRSDRTLKKLHLGSYAETCVDIVINIDASKFQEDEFFNLYDVLFDAMYELPYTETELQTCGMERTNYSIMYCIPSTKFNEEEVQKRTEEVLRLFSEIDPVFADVQSVCVKYADAFYGEW